MAFRQRTASGHTAASLSAAAAAAIEAAIGVMAEEPWRQQRVRKLAKDVRARLAKSGLKIPDGDSPIIPILLGSEGSAMEASKKLEKLGLLVAAVRPPTVARGTSRLRVTLSCEHSDEDVDLLLSGLRKCIAEMGAA